MRLVVEQRIVFELDPRIAYTIGRSEQATIVIDEVTLARVHFRLSSADGRWFVEDLESPSGTWVNDRQARGPTELRPGDQLRAGRLNMRLV